MPPAAGGSSPRPVGKLRFPVDGAGPGTGAAGLTTGGATTAAVPASDPATALAAGFGDAGPGVLPGTAAGAATAGADAAAGACSAAFGGAFSAALPPPKASRSRRATGASTVDEADLTNSPCSLRRARTSLLVTPSSFANSCTRALPATTSPSLEATAVGGPRLGFSYDAWSSGLHGVLMFFATCSLSWSPSAAKCSVTPDTSGEPVMRNARLKARRRIAADRQ